MNRIKIFIFPFVFFVLGLLLSFFYQEFRYSNLEKEIWDSAKKRMYETNYFQVADDNTPIKGVSGVIQEIGDNEMRVKISPLGPMEDSDLDIRIIKINNSTKIQKIQKMSQDEYEEEMKKIEIDENTDFNNVDVPNTIVAIDSNFKELKIGQTITVSSNDNIKNSKQFIAERIIIQL